MKKILVAMMLLTALTSHSQNRFGAIGGVSSSSFSDSFLDDIYFTKAFGFHIGGVYEYQLNNTIAFRPKLVFSLHGMLSGISPKIWGVN